MAERHVTTGREEKEKAQIIYNSGIPLAFLVA